jgi:hypothetical protein
MSRGVLPHPSLTCFGYLERLHPFDCIHLSSLFYIRLLISAGRVRGAFGQPMCVPSVHSMCHHFTSCGYFPGNDHHICLPNPCKTRPGIPDELGVGGLIERIKNRRHHKLAVRQGLGRRIYRDTARWPLYLERNVPFYRYPRARPTRLDLGGSCMKLPHLGRFGARRSGVPFRVTRNEGGSPRGVV